MQNTFEKARDIVDLAQQMKYKISTAESVTGGRISSALTSIAGSSKVFPGGVVCYTEHTKIHSAGADVRDIEEHGVYSHKIVEQMAERIAKRNQADIGIATSGCAESGESTCPQGTVYFGVYNKKRGCTSHVHVFDGGREEIQNSATKHALQCILDILHEKPQQ